MQFIYLLFALYVIVIIFVVWINIKYNWDLYSIKDHILIFLELIIEAVPPGLLFAYVIGTVIISKRLKDNNIFCIIENRLVECGRVK